MKRTLLPTHAFFNKALLIFSLLSLFQMNSYAQGPKWTTLGNTSSTGDFIGPTNYQPLIFKTNNIARGAFTATGNFQLNNLIGSGERFLQTDANGNIIPFAMGTSTQVLYGNGIWGALPTIPTALWNQSGSNIYYTGGNIGVGNTHPLFQLDVSGDVRISNNLYVGGGIIITDKVNANTQVKTARVVADSIVTDSTKGFYGTSNFNGAVKLQNRLDVTGNSVFNGSVTANSISTTNLTTTNFSVSTLLAANKISAYRITGQSGDSLVRIGDSTINFDFVHNRIWAGSITAPDGITYGGLGLGLATTARGVRSLAIGAGTKTGAGATQAIVIGASASMVNTIPNSLMIGFNSDVPTIFVSNSAGAGTTGKVGIGGIIPPSSGSIYKLYVEGGIVTRDVKVTASSFPDYVFASNYNLLSINELEKYISNNHHLPHIQSAKEIEKNEGYEIGDMQIKLVKTVEEQALYIIDLQKQMDELKKEIVNMKKK